MSPITAPTEVNLCHCLRVSESQIRAAVELAGCQTIRDVRRQTGAGSGCTACHRRICALIDSVQAPCDLQESA